jgi:cell surface protein SprA
LKTLALNIIVFTFVVSWLPVTWGPSGNYFPLKNPIAPPDTVTGDTVVLPWGFKDRSELPGQQNTYQSGLYMRMPANLNEDVEYDAEQNEYRINQKMGNLQYRPTEYYTFEEYQKYDADRQLKNYWKQRFLSENFQHQSSLIPQLHIGSEVFETIFGSNVIDIKPQGSAELIFGVQINRTENPQLPEKMRKTTTFDFQEKIQMNVTGQIGDKMKIATNYNTEASFEFENKMNLVYEGKEDEIIQKIEAGNVSLPLSGSLISGSQSLFGIKTELQFGRLNVTTVFSQQKGKSQVVEVQGGAQVQDFEVWGDQYEANRHFFLNRYFYDTYNRAMQSLPIISSSVNITRVEVWVTNKTGNFNDTRNIVALTDLGENLNQITNANNISDTTFSITGNTAFPYYPDNQSNNLFDLPNQYPGIRLIKDVTTSMPWYIKQGRGYEKVEHARKLNPSEFTFNPALGFISLNSALNSDEVLAVAYEYTVGGTVYKVGELSNTIDPPNTLMLKLIKGTAFTPRHPNWRLMMKNIYSIGAWQINKDDFKLDVFYQNDKTGTALHYINEGAIKERPLISVLNLDNLNSMNEGSPDGVFDFLESITIRPDNGRVIFPCTEPFGSYLYNKFAPVSTEDETTARSYCFFELYDSTQSKARQIAEKNKFFLKGRYKSSSSSEINLNAINIPQGSVVVTAGGQKLTENVDYTVDYTLGRVKIINQAYLQSGIPIKISLESQALFSLQSKTMLGARLNYTISKDFNIGATILNLTERPLTQKVNIGDEPISNTIWGVDGTWRADAPLLTKLVDLLPFIETKAPSNITVAGEFAHLIPGHNKVIDKAGMSYIDDFEGSKTSIDLRAAASWKLASTPQANKVFPNNDGDKINNLEYGFNRAKLAWYYIDPLFLRTNNSTTPQHLVNSPQLNNHFVREIYETELFPNRQNPSGYPQAMTVLNLAYYPRERGPYNYSLQVDSAGFLLNPKQRWGGIMRKIESNDFEAANIEFIELWLMDPFVYDNTHTGAKLYFHLGNISEDILRDGWKSHEEGLPTTAEVKDVDISAWGRVPIKPALVHAFSNDQNARQYQDIGLDGLSSADEVSFFSSQNPDQTHPYLDLLAAQFGSSSQAYLKALADPSSDDYHYFRGGDYDQQELSILDRYKRYNNLEGNSPTDEQSPEDYNTSATQQIDEEDINRDNTLSELESYFQYRLDLRPDKMYIGENYITDIVKGKNKDNQEVKFYQIKIPLYSPDSIVGDIIDFKSIRFMRMFVSGCDKELFLRFAELKLVRGEWRKYNDSFLEGGVYIPVETEDAAFDVSAVNIEENGTKQPVNYVLPPGVSRVIDPTNPQLRELNEQALTLKVCGLQDGDARACYRNVDMDVRQYKRIQMFVHAEAVPGYSLNDNDLCAFIRLGSDYKNNYYEYEIPLQLTTPGSYNDESEDDRKLVWPDANMFNFAFDVLQGAKQERNNEMRKAGSTVTLTSAYETFDENNKNNKISVMGNPNLSNVRTIMIGVRNRNKNKNPLPDDGMSKCGEIWMNELRLTDFDEKGGWAANLRVTARLADFGSVSVSGFTSTPGFGSLEKKVSERSKEQVNQYDLSSTLELGKFLPEKVKLSVPMFIGYSESFRNPQYNPLDPDIPLKVSLDDLQSKQEKDSLRFIVQDYTRRKSMNFTNVKLNQTTPPKIYSPSNWAASYAYSEMYSRNINTEYNRLKNYRGALTYNFSMTPKNVAPFAANNLFKSPYLKLIKDFNFYYAPNQISFMTDINRMYNEVQSRSVDNPDYRLPATYNKDFSWNRIYDLKWDFTKSLKFDFNANNIARIDEPTVNQRVNKAYKDEYEQWKDTVMNSAREFGRTTSYRHQYNLNYTLPINKIPILNWITVNARYGGAYDWTTGPRTADTIRLGNTIKNNNNIQLTATASMNNLYNKVPYLKKVNQKFSKQKRPGQKKPKVKVQFPKQGDPPRYYRFVKDVPKIITHKLLTEDVTVKVLDTASKEIKVEVKILSPSKVAITTDADYRAASVVINGEREEITNPWVEVLDNSLRVMMMLKTVSVSYTEANGTFVPGYLPQTSVMGMQQTGDVFAPGASFVAGWQDRNYLDKAHKNGWLTTDTLLNSAYLLNTTQTLNIRANIEPINGMRIDVTANRTFGTNITEYYRYNPATGDFYRHSQMITGSFSMTYGTWRTAFEKLTSSDFNSEVFEQFKNYRITIAQRQASERFNSRGADDYGYSATVDPTTGFPDGYSPTSQEVLIPAFLAAYSGKNPSNVSLDYFPGIASMMPNWTLTYDGLVRIKLIKKYFRSLTVSHAYRSSYSVNSYTTSVEFNDVYDDGFGWVRYTLGNFIPQHEIAQVSISEQFSPLLNFDGTLNNSFIMKFELKKTRNLSFSLSNNQLTEMRGNEMIFGTGYRFKDVKFIISSGSSGGREFKSDLNTRADISIRDDYTIIRKVEQTTTGGYSMITSGTKMITIKISADYVLSNRFNLRLFYDRIVRQPKVSNLFETYNTNIGISVRFTLTQ